jgi:uncharacterized protein YoxC
VPVPRRLLLVAVLAAAALAGGCGGGDDEESSATDWADSVCSSVTTWTESVTSAADTLREGGLSEDGLRGAADEVKDATSTLADDLKGLGRPDTDAGGEAKESLDELADDLEQEVDDIESAVDDVSGGSGVLTAVSTISSSLLAMGNQVTSAVQELEQVDVQGDLEEAFRNADSCEDLTSSS